ncbi:Biotin carboxyl carrier protein [Staphylococcus lugdunensis]|uniref:acetyl-CoA carboxylase biotin carboxyl carrier protein n=1 Tax=Staphylococcus lugdunensis TaxID=28035 RepID=UPI000DA3CE7B|nr:acetyl-CoA carboxylase biotin carboxyl carrier protein subunit [Staphylococcus lugdunensis]SQE71629.1 Biotin carboxyl carrier protein [Staphylococcus lugdunensis]
MNLDKIEQIIDLVKKNEVKKFKYKDFEHEIELDFTEDVSPVSANKNDIQTTSTNHSDSNKQDEANPKEETLQIKASMVGTFFLQDSKELTQPVVQVGDKIQEGDIVGYIEAMKVMNEVTSDVSGEIVEILVDHGTNVEYDQALIQIK